MEIVYVLIWVLVILLYTETKFHWTMSSSHHRYLFCLNFKNTILWLTHSPHSYSGPYLIFSCNICDWYCVSIWLPAPLSNWSSPYGTHLIFIKEPLYLLSSQLSKHNPYSKPIFSCLTCWVSSGTQLLLMFSSSKFRIGSEYHFPHRIMLYRLPYTYKVPAT